MKNIFASTIYAGGAHPVEDSDIDDAISYIESEIIVKSETIPEASESYYKAVYQYIGETDSNYTHGYIYECKKSDNSTVVFTPGIIECSGEDFTTFLEDVGSGYDYDSVVAGTMEYAQDADLWIFTGKNSDDETVFTYQQYTQDFVDAGFTFTGTYEDGDIVTFERTVEYIYEWSRLDVQPDSTDLTNYYTKTETNSLLNNKANTGLDNLNADGQMIIDSQNGTISNCILEIPQNIKLEISGGTITLKAGSTVVNTGSTYATVTTTQDTTLNVNPGNYGDRWLLLFNYGNMNLQLKDVANVYSGSTFPESLPNNNDFFYNTTDKIIYLWRPNEEVHWYPSGYRYPLAVIQKKSSSEWQFVKDSNGNDMIFNGAGFIGHHVFVYPNVSGLVPYGINSDGTLKSFYQKLASLYIIDMDSSWQGTVYQSYTWIALNSFSGKIGIAVLSDIEYESPYDMPATGSLRNYVKSRNLYMNQNNIGGFNELTVVKFIKYAYDGTTVTDFTIRQPVRTATTEMLDSATTKAKTYKGTYDTTIQYYAGDIVKYSDEIYEALQDNINANPSTSTTNWSKLTNDKKVKYVEKSDNVEYPIGLASDNASGSIFSGFMYFTTQNKPTINASTGVVTVSGGIVGKTEAAGDNSTKYATTAFVNNAISTNASAAVINARTGTDVLHIWQGSEQQWTEGKNITWYDWETSSSNTNFSVVGSVNITDKIASNFSLQNYLTLNSVFSPQNNDTWEIDIKCKTNSYNRNQFEPIFTSFTNTHGAGIWLATENNGYLTLSLSSNGTNWDICDHVSTYLLDLGTVYYIKAGYDGTQYYLQAKKETDSNYTNIYTLTSSVKVYDAFTESYIGVRDNTASGNGFFYGDVYLDNMSLSINNIVVWTPYANNKVYTDTLTPTTSSVVYSEPNVVSALTITATSSDSITLSNTDVYSYTPSGNQTTYQTIGDAYPTWICNINGVGVKVGNILIADNTNLTSITGYDATKTQTLKNVSGTLTWVDDTI